MNEEMVEMFLGTELATLREFAHNVRQAYDDWTDFSVDDCFIGCGDTGPDQSSTEDRMTALHITQAQWDAVTDGCPVLIVAGEICRAHDGKHRWAPAEFVAAANGKCGTCGGTGDVETRCGLSNCDDGVFYNSSDWSGDWDACPTCRSDECPDCDGTGRPQITLTVNCETCGGDGIDGSHDAAAYYAYSGEISSCNNCYGNGKRTVGTITITAVVPVVEAGKYDDICSAYEGPSAVEVGPTGGMLWPKWDSALEDDDGTDLTPWSAALAPNGPDSIVGHYALILGDLIRKLTPDEP